MANVDKASSWVCRGASGREWEGPSPWLSVARGQVGLVDDPPPAAAAAQQPQPQQQPPPIRRRELCFSAGFGIVSSASCLIGRKRAQLLLDTGVLFCMASLSVTISKIVLPNF